MHNNPVGLIDPDGHETCTVEAEPTCWSDAETIGLGKLNPDGSVRVDPADVIIPPYQKPGKQLVDPNGHGGQRGVAQELANFAGGYVKGVSLGNEEWLLDESKVNWESGSTTGGEVVGLAALIPLAIGNPGVFAWYSRGAGATNAGGECFAGQGDGAECGVAVATLGFSELGGVKGPAVSNGATFFTAWVSLGENVHGEPSDGPGSQPSRPSGGGGGGRLVQ